MQKFILKLYLLSPVADGANEQLNPGFETAGGGGADVFANWTETTFHGTISQDSDVFRSGAASCKITSTGDGDYDYVGIYIPGGVVAGETFKLTFWTRGDGNVAGKYSVYDFTNGVHIIEPTTTGIIGTTWTQVTVEWEIPVGCVACSYALHKTEASSGSVYFDDVSLVETFPDEWVEITDVMGDRPVVWESGLPGPNVFDLVARTGILSFSLDNSAQNSASKLGLYSPDHANALAGFVEGARIAITLEVA